MESTSSRCPRPFTHFKLRAPYVQGRSVATRVWRSLAPRGIAMALCTVQRARTLRRRWPSSWVLTLSMKRALRTPPPVSARRSRCPCARLCESRTHAQVQVPVCGVRNPRRYLLKIVAQSMMAPLPHGWKELLDKESQPYYYNAETNNTTWDHPLDTCDVPSPAILARRSQNVRCCPRS